MAIYTGVTVNFLGKRFGDWRFSWSYILGWVALLMTFFAGLFMSAVEFITWYAVESKIIHLEFKKSFTFIHFVFITIIVDVAAVVRLCCH